MEVNCLLSIGLQTGSMANFPELQPSTRIWLPGNAPQTAVASLSGASTRISHGSSRFGDSLVLSFVNRSESDSNKISLHFSNQNGTRDSFELPAAVFAGLNGYEQLIANGNRWIYVSAPTIEYLSPDVHTITIELLQVLR